MTTPVASRSVHYKAWNYVGATYNHRTGVAKLYVNSKLVASRRIGRIKLSTNHPIRIGAIDGDRRRLRGRVFCVQVYDKPLTRAQIANVAKKCFLKGEFTLYSLPINISARFKTIAKEIFCAFVLTGD